MQIVRLIRHRRTVDRPAVPLGMVGTLILIEQIGDRSAGCHAKELAIRSGLNASTVSRAVTALVTHGLVERRADPTDKRATFLGLTAAGRAALADARSWYGEVLDRALADWRPAEIAALTSALGRFISDLQGALHLAPDATQTNDMLEAAR
jgi:DNA-binding MarR family transcriptional regulator